MLACLLGLCLSGSSYGIATWEVFEGGSTARIQTENSVPVKRVVRAEPPKKRMAAVEVTPGALTVDNTDATTENGQTWIQMYSSGNYYGQIARDKAHRTPVSTPTTIDVNQTQLPELASDTKCCAAPWSACGELTVHVSHWGTLGPGNYVDFNGFNARAEIYCKGETKYQSNNPAKYIPFPSGCIGASTFTVRCGGHCGDCRMKNRLVKIIPTPTTAPPTPVPKAAIVTTSLSTTTMSTSTRKLTSTSTATTATNATTSDVSDTDEAIIVGVVVGLITLSAGVAYLVYLKNRKDKAPTVNRASADIIEESVGRMTNEEFRRHIQGIGDTVERAMGLAYHFTDEKTAKLIISSLGLRASKVGQGGGGVYICTAQPSDLGWAPFCGGDFRETVGKALWSTKYEEVMEGGPQANKLDALLVLRISEKILQDKSLLLPDRENVVVLPPSILLEQGGFHWLTVDKVVRVCYLNK